MPQRIANNAAVFHEPAPPMPVIDISEKANFREIETYERAAPPMIHTTTPAQLYVPMPQKPTAITLATFTTEYNQKDRNRTHNLEKAANVINEMIIAPDATFSFNEAIGPSTKKAGYKSARVFVRGVEKEGYGGGICQVSSTLYNAALTAGLDVVERHAHSKRVYYVPEGGDAATAYGSVDLKIKNATVQPVKILCHAVDGKLIVQLMQMQP